MGSEFIKNITLYTVYKNNWKLRKKKSLCSSGGTTLWPELTDILVS
jgi:hypothetical protein